MNKWFVVGFAAVVFVVLLLVGSSLMVNLEADKVMVIQSLDGTLTCYTNPGWQWQGLGHVTKYPRQESYDFIKEKVVDKIIVDNSKKLRFNDGGHADLSGSVNWLMPMDCKSIVEIQKYFGSPEGVIAKGVSKMVDSAVYMSGPLMSSTESSAERRAELVQIINDQAQNGVYVTTTETVQITDQITNEKKMVTIVKIAKDEKGLPKRQQGSILDEYGIKLQPVAIKGIDYDGVVEKQIAQRQDATTSVQISKAAALRAQQDAITAEAQGQANAAKAKWEQETIKAKEVTLAEQKLRVAELAAKEAEQYKRKQILEGEGDAEKKKLVMAADGALQPKLDALIKINEVWAENFGKFQGSMVPSVNMGGNTGGSAVTNAQTFMELMTAQAAKALSVDVSTTGKEATAKKK